MNIGEPKMKMGELKMKMGDTKMKSLRKEPSSEKRQLTSTLIPPPPPSSNIGINGRKSTSRLLKQDNQLSSIQQQIDKKSFNRLYTALKA